MLSSKEKRQLYARVKGYLLHTGGATISSIKRDISKESYVNTIIKDMLKSGYLRFFTTGGWKKPTHGPNWIPNYWSHKSNTYPRETWYVPI